MALERPLPFSFGFPYFPDGDVGITISSEHYQFHSQVLSRHSGFFKAVLAKARDMWKMLNDNDDDGDDLPYIELVLVKSERCRYGVFEVHVIADFIREVENVAVSPSWPETTCSHWLNIFKSFYGISPDLYALGIDNVPTLGCGLFDIAHTIQASNFISGAITNALVPDQKLYNSIPKLPINWACLADRIQSTDILKDTIVHLVGNWTKISQQQRNCLPPWIHRLCNIKFFDLLQRKIAINNTILAHYPTNITLTNKDGDTVPIEERQTQAAALVYRQWVCHKVYKRHAHNADDGGAEFYRAIVTGGDRYLDTGELVRFINNVQLMRRDMGLVLHVLTEFKEEMKQFVMPLMVNRTHWQGSKTMAQLPYLTCCEVEDEDIVWEERPDDMEGMNDFTSTSLQELVVAEFWSMKRLQEILGGWDPSVRDILEGM